MPHQYRMITIELTANVDGWLPGSRRQCLSGIGLDWIRQGIAKEYVPKSRKRKSDSANLDHPPVKRAASAAGVAN